MEILQMGNVCSRLCSADAKTKIQAYTAKKTVIARQAVAVFLAIPEKGGRT